MECDFGVSVIIYSLFFFAFEVRSLCIQVNPHYRISNLQLIID